MTRIIRISLISALLAASVAAVPASANPGPTQQRGYVQAPQAMPYYMPEPRRDNRWAQRKISYAEAKAIAMRRYPGAAYVDIALRGNIYYVRLESNGRVFDVRVDAVTGRIR